MSQLPNEDLARMLKAVGHPVRLEIISEVARRCAPCCGDVCDCFPLSQSTVSQHLSVLNEAGVLDFERRGNKSHYRLNREALAQLRDALGEILHAESGATEQV